MIIRSHPAAGPFAVLACCFVAAGCEKKSSPTESRVRERTAAKSIANRLDNQVANQREHSKKKHDPTHPPIDCPLRKQGIDPCHMRPFDDVERSITFLEREDRAVC